MKEIKAVIRPQKLSALRDALRNVPGFPGMTVSRVEGLSAPARVGPCRESIRAQLTDFSAKVRLDILAPDDLVDTLVERIRTVADTGQIGDGLVWVTPVEQLVFVHQTRGCGGAEGG